MPMIDDVMEQIIDLIGCEIGRRCDGQRQNRRRGGQMYWLPLLKESQHQTGDPKAPLQALIFDSVFNQFRGVIAYYKIMNGTVKERGPSEILPH